MKSVKSRADLERMALSQGASVAVGGSVFNASGETAKVVAMPKAGDKPKEVAPAPAPAPVAHSVEVHPQVHVDMQPVADAQRDMAQLIAGVLAGLPKPAEPVRQWRFSVTYGADGAITDIIAKAQ